MKTDNKRFFLTVFMQQYKKKTSKKSGIVIQILPGIKDWLGTKSILMTAALLSVYLEDLC